MPVTEDYINEKLARRQLGYGRGGRMQIEDDKVEILSGIRGSSTIGSPIALLIKNKDYANWQEIMATGKTQTEPLTIPRPGHADLAGLLKTGQSDIRNILERSSARETAARMAGASLCCKLLDELGVIITSHVTSIGAISSEKTFNPAETKGIDKDPVRMADRETSKKAVAAIDEAKNNGDTLGGTFQVIAFNVIAGLGSYAGWQDRLDAELAKAIVSIPAVKGVSFGKGFKVSRVPGSHAHDEIFYDKGYYRKTNRAGGLEGGMSNGEPIVINAAMKPIPTLGKALKTIDIHSKKDAQALKERADVTAVPSAAVIAEAMVALTLTNAYLVKFGGDNLNDLKSAVSSYSNRLK